MTLSTSMSGLSQRVFFPLLFGLLTMAPV